jgi:hypothetical protein
VHRFVYFANERLTQAELSAARLDGHVVELGEGYVPADTVESAALRGASLRNLLPDTLAATRLTAAWVHGAVDELPPRLEVQRAVARRIHHVRHPRLVYRDVVVAPGHLQRVGGTLVTSPARTLADLARVRATGGPHPAVDTAIRRLTEAPGAVRAAIVVLALHDGVPGKREALRRLRAIEPERATTT